MRRLWILAFVATLVLAIGIPPVGAGGKGKPVFTEKWSFTSEDSGHPHHDDFLTGMCGIEVIHTVAEGKGHFKAYADGSITDHFNTEQAWYSPETGETLVRTDAGTFRGMGVEEFDPSTGYLTITFEDQVVGNPVKWSKPGEGTLLLDAGNLMISGTLVLDVSQDPPVEVSFEENLDIRGPHPEFMMDFDTIIDSICGWLGA